jgi:hypothetical protein
LATKIIKKYGNFDKNQRQNGMDLMFFIPYYQKKAENANTRFPPEECS